MQKIRNEGIIISFGDRLSKLRKQKGVTQEELAERAGISQVQVARIEKGKLNTTISTIYGIAGALGVSPKDII
ncbi:MAG: helix-turn-helix domain-containing protein [Cytophagales bacterium]|nr:helix-turn-helix domain-containing protein [Cytophagales bacterium]